MEESKVACMGRFGRKKGKKCNYIVISKQKEITIIHISNNLERSARTTNTWKLFQQAHSTDMSGKEHNRTANSETCNFSKENTNF